MTIVQYCLSTEYVSCALRERESQEREDTSGLGQEVAQGRGWRQKRVLAKFGLQRSLLDIDYDKE